MSQGLWVEHKTDIRTYLAWISIKKYEFVGQIISKIKKDTQLAIPKHSMIALYGPLGTAIEVDEPISSLLPGNSSKTPLRIQVTDPSKPAPDAELNSFWNSLHGMKPEDGFLKFQVRMSLLPERLKWLYIREAYKDMFQIIWNNLHSNNETKERFHRMAITGTPGTGKSMFLFYILWRLANIETIKAVIIYRQTECGGIYVFRKSGCWETFNYSDVAGLLKDDSTYTWYLTDALEPPPARVEAVTILVSSPARKYYSTFLPLSHVAPLYYLPIWSLEELQLVAPIYSRSPKIVEK